MIQVIIHRVCYWIEDGKQVELHGLRVFAVPDCWTASMGVILDDGGDPYMPDDFRCFVNESGCVVLDLNTWWKPNINETPLENAECWFGDSWKWCRSSWGHYHLSVADVLDLPAMTDGIEAMCPTTKGGLDER